MSKFLEMVITVVCAVFASSGFWAFLQKIGSKKDASKKLLVGLAHDRIIFLGQRYIDIGSITSDEYENLVDYLYIPYVECGGNGTAEKVINDVKKLPIRKG